MTWKFWHSQELSIGLQCLTLLPPHSGCQALCTGSWEAGKAASFFSYKKTLCCFQYLKEPLGYFCHSAATQTNLPQLPASLTSVGSGPWRPACTEEPKGDVKPAFVAPLTVPECYTSPITGFIIINFHLQWFVKSKTRNIKLFQKTESAVETTDRTIRKTKGEERYEKNWETTKSVLGEPEMSSHKAWWQYSYSYLVYISICGGDYYCLWDIKIRSIRLWKQESYCLETSSKINKSVKLL